MKYITFIFAILILLTSCKKPKMAHDVKFTVSGTADFFSAAVYAWDNNDRPGYRYFNFFDNIKSGWDTTMQLKSGDSILFGAMSGLGTQTIKVQAFKNDKLINASESDTGYASVTMTIP